MVGDTLPTDEPLSIAPFALTIHCTHAFDAYKVLVLVPLSCKAEEALMVGAVSVPVNVGSAVGAA